MASLPRGLLGEEASRDEDTERLLSVLGSLALRRGLWQAAAA